MFKHAAPKATTEAYMAHARDVHILCDSEALKFSVRAVQ